MAASVVDPLKCLVKTKQQSTKTGQLSTTKTSAGVSRPLPSYAEYMASRGLRIAERKPGKRRAASEGDGPIGRNGLLLKTQRKQRLLTNFELDREDGDQLMRWKGAKRGKDWGKNEVEGNGLEKRRLLLGRLTSSPLPDDDGHSPQSASSQLERNKRGGRRQKRRAAVGSEQRHFLINKLLMSTSDHAEKSEMEPQKNEEKTSNGTDEIQNNNTLESSKYERIEKISTMGQKEPIESLDKPAIKQSTKSSSLGKLLRNILMAGRDSRIIEINGITAVEEMSTPEIGAKKGKNEKSIRKDEKIKKEKHQENVKCGTPGHGSGIYVKGIIAGSPAEKDGRISAGDQLLSVNGQSLLGIQQEIAAQNILSAGPVVHLEVAKKAAQMNGIAPYLQNGFGPQQAQITTQKMSQQNGQHQQPTNLGRFSSQQPLPQLKGRGTVRKGLIERGGADGQPVIRPKSASELQQQTSVEMNQIMNIAGRAPNGSLRNPVIYGTPSSQQQLNSSSQYAQIQHSQQSSTSSLASRLPAHYKPASNRPQCVLQPGRPPSSSPLNSRRSQSTPTQSDQSITPTLHNEDQNLTNGTGTPFTTPVELSGKGDHLTFEYSSQMPSIGKGRPAIAESPPINSSTTNSTASCETAEWMNKQERQQQKDPSSPRHHPPMIVHSKQYQLPSGRLSAPIFGAEQHQQQQHESFHDVERELDELDSSDGQMSDADQRRYRELLERLAKMKKERTFDAGKSTIVRLPPSMIAAAQQLERQSKSLAALSLDTGRLLPCSSSMASKSLSNLPPIKIIEPVKLSTELDPRNSCASRELVQEIKEVVKKKKPPAVPAKPTIREFQRPPSAVEFDSSARKRVQFSIEQNNENIELEERTEKESEQEDPRVQIIGAQEIYVNDPRQRRLQELQANQKVLKPVIDSSALGFREKMRIFAEQLGEKEQPNWKSPQHKSSTAERQIPQNEASPEHE